MKWLDIRFEYEESINVPEMYNLETAKYIGPQYLDTQAWTIRYSTNSDPKQHSIDDYVFYAGYFWPEEHIKEYISDLQKLVSAFLRSKEQTLLIHMDEPERFKGKLKLLQEKEGYLPS